MVLRSWGERGVHAGDFRHLVTGRPVGITTDDLMDAVRDRGGRTALSVGWASTDALLPRS